MKIRASLAVAIALVPGFAAAQAAQDAPVPRPVPTTIVTAHDLQRLPSPALAALPDGSRAWTLQVTTTGGVMGAGARSGNFAVTSDGRLACELPGCAPGVRPDDLARLASLLAGLDASLWRGIPTVAEQASLCRDCLRTTLVLRKREGDGVAIYAASWDPTQRVAEPLRDLANVLRQLTREQR